MKCSKKKTKLFKYKTDKYFCCATRKFNSSMTPKGATNLIRTHDGMNLTSHLEHFKDENAKIDILRVHIFFANHVCA